MTVGKARIAPLAPLLEPLLSDPSAHVRASAIYALTRLGEPVDRTPLASMLLDDPSPWVRRHTAYILGELGDPSAMGLLRTAARRQYPDTPPEQTRNFQLQLAEAMIKLGDDRQRQAIRAALYPARPEELESAALAAQIIGETGDREAVHQVASLGEYRDAGGNPHPAEVRLAIAAALGAMGHRRGTTVADEFASSDSPALRAQSAHVYGQVGGTDRLGALSRLLADDVPTVRVAAAAAILRAATRNPTRD